MFQTELFELLIPLLFKHENKELKVSKFSSNG